MIENKLQLNDIVQCKRIGLPNSKSGRSRLVLVIMRYKQDALKLHNWGVGTKINAKAPIWINPDLTKTERDVRFRLQLKKQNAKKVNEEKKVANQYEDKCATNPGSAMQALQNENRLVVVDNTNVERNSNSAVADKLPVEYTSISSSASPDITESKTARSSDQVSSSKVFQKTNDYTKWFNCIIHQH